MTAGENAAPAGGIVESARIVVAMWEQAIDDHPSYANWDFTDNISALAQALAKYDARVALHALGVMPTDPFGSSDKTPQSGRRGDVS